MAWNTRVEKAEERLDELGFTSAADSVQIFKTLMQAVSVDNDLWPQPVNGSIPWFVSSVKSSFVHVFPEFENDIGLVALNPQVGTHGVKGVRGSFTSYCPGPHRLASSAFEYPRIDKAAEGFLEQLCCFSRCLINSDHLPIPRTHLLPISKGIRRALNPYVTIGVDNAC